MTKNKALRILGLGDSYTKEELKKAYRSLIKQIHPDITDAHEYPYEISEINAAYEYLSNAKFYINDEHGIQNRRRRSAEKEASTIRWNAPVNPHAFCDRTIFHNVEDMDGSVIGQAVIDSGKYLWSMDEEFMLFQKSLFECSKYIIATDDEIKDRDRINDISLQGEIAYLLAQQFVDISLILNNSSIVGKISESTYLVDAMVEDVDSYTRFKEGELLIPGRISKHRLYISNSKEKEIGYLSFRDDRLYYGIIPLFERRAAQIKLQIIDATVKRQARRRYIDISLMIRLIEEDNYQMTESINSKIIRLLE